MSDSDRVLVLISVVIVLLVSLYASRTTSAGLGLVVALVGLVVALRRPVYGIPVALVMTVVASVAPWAVLLIIAFAGLLLLATKAPEVASSRVDPVVGVSGADAARDIGAGIGAGVGNLL